VIVVGIGLRGIFPHRVTDQVELACAAYRNALDLTMNMVERDFILERIASLSAQ
jgi:predicted RNA polymerase sigma factor